MGKEPIGVIFAGGKGERLGLGPKADVLLDGKPLLTHIAERLAPQCKEILVSARPSQSVPGDHAVIPDIEADADAGIMVGIISAVRWMTAHRPGQSFVTAPVDTPFLPDDYVGRLSADPARPAVVHSTNRVHGLSAYFPASSFAAIEEVWVSGERMVRALHERIRSRAVVLGDGQEDVFLNINTQEDLKAAAALMSRR
ncbi:molybdenum cofactor guanylyltransferase [Parvularcula sp. LCG005]|uniref:molybdenum cofactor guanylyltransferase n=1 Tax=Parvularcula sp. LCG005 TaxID=3078805 RepID=UPI0029436424|nr:NTP transferase domain-containing protein [Parvularcula sp. LCG005]WOI52203.1 NTP transferase domain-containing protein [Parvularcula sp. LCG005]